VDCTIKKPHVHTRTSGIENPVLRNGFRTGKKLIFVSRDRRLRLLITSEPGLTRPERKPRLLAAPTTLERPSSHCEIFLAGILELRPPTVPGRAWRSAASAMCSANSACLAPRQRPSCQGGRAMMFSDSRHAVGSSAAVLQSAIHADYVIIPWHVLPPR